MIRHRRMSVADLALVLDWAADEGWNPGTGDAEAFHAADPQGFFLAVEREKPVAAISVVNHSPDFAFLGLYLCLPGYRGRGIGHALWKLALTHAGDRTVGLDGVPDQQANYARSGFTLAGRTTRFSGPVDALESPDIRLAAEEDVPALIDMEAAASGWRKPAALDAWFRNTPDRTTLVCDRHGSLAGAATVRRCRSGSKIGPLVASDETVARNLIAHAATRFGNQIVIDVPSSSAGQERLCGALHLAPGFQTARMYRGPFPATRADHFAVSTLELG